MFRTFFKAIFHDFLFENLFLKEICSKIHLKTSLFYKKKFFSHVSNGLLVIFCFFEEKNLKIILWKHSLQRNKLPFGIKIHTLRRRGPFPLEQTTNLCILKKTQKSLSHRFNHTQFQRYLMISHTSSVYSVMKIIIILERYEIDWVWCIFLSFFVKPSIQWTTKNSH